MYYVVIKSLNRMEVNVKKLLILIFLSNAVLAMQNNYSTASQWLMDMDVVDDRFRAIEKQFRGFDTAMMEVGYRYEAIKKALFLHNYELASYHLQKVQVAIENGYIRRPARKEASQNYFLNTTFKELQKALETKDDTLVTHSFDNLKNSCNACHINQNVGFIVIE